jgi:type IV pilus assembly protein PilO
MSLREPFVQKGLAAIVLLIALVWLIFISSYLPFSYGKTSEERQMLREELQLVAGELQRLKASIHNLPKLKAEVEDLGDRWEKLKNILPRRSEMSSLLSDITTEGLKAGVQFTLFEPGQPEQQPLYVRYPVRIGVTGNYHQVGRFFDGVCNIERLIGVSEISVSQFEQGAELRTVEAMATLSAYTYSEAAQNAADGASEPRGTAKRTKE